MFIYPHFLTNLTADHVHGDFWFYITFMQNNFLILKNNFTLINLRYTI